MKRCPKCNRSFADDNQKFCTVDGGLLISSDQPFDPNATVHSTVRPHDPEPGKRAADGSYDWNETIALSESPDAPTAVLPRQTGPTGAPTAGNMRPPPPSAAPPPLSSPKSVPAAQAPPPPKTQSVPPLPKTESVPPLPAAAPQTIAATPQKKSKLPLILGTLALLLIFGVAALAAGVYFLVIKPRREVVQAEPPVLVTNNESENLNSNVNTNAEPAVEPEQTVPAFVAPPNTTKFANSDANLDGKLAEHYFDFSFYYPDNWAADPKAGVPGASNFAKVERKLPDMMQESFAVGWYSSKGSFAADEETFPQLVETLGAALAKSFPGYHKVSEGPTKVNSLDGYEFRFVSSSANSASGDLQLWGRVIFLPSGTAGENGATLFMLATSRAPELSGVEDVGGKGEMPVILESFRFGRAD